ncbi:MAG: hypothetical protein K8M05_00895, partial [Deltaproteobacteria bacterium]|nr:hypothetical protein [Kofleriaceae bacterium]
MTGAVARVVVLAGVAACGVEQTGRDLCDEGLCAAGTLTFGAQAASFTRSTVEAVAITPDEPPWFAGTFDSDLTIDDGSIPWDGAGYRDPFLARTGVRDLAPLVIDGSAGYPQRVVGVVPDAEDGALVFTIGQQEDTRHRYTAAWYQRSGRLVVSDTVALLDAAGPLGGASVTIDARGWPIVAASGTNVDLDGVMHLGEWAIVMRLGQGLRPEIVVWLMDVEIADVAVDDDLLAIAGSYRGAPVVPEGSAPWPACADPEPCGFVAAIELSNGVVRWVQPIRAPG